MITFIVLTMNSAFAYEFCRSGGSFNNQSHCIQEVESNISGWGNTSGFKNICNELIRFDFCYTYGANNYKYSCSSSGNQPTQFGGLAPGKIKHIYRKKGSPRYGIRHWAYNC